MIMQSLRKIESNRENLKKAVLARQAGAWIDKICFGCGKPCLVRRSAIKKGWKYCSWSCRTKNMIGSNAPNFGGGAWMRGNLNMNYKHGNSKFAKRDLAEVNRWRRLVFARDKYTCQKCGYKKGRILQSHHIAGWTKYPDLRFDIANGITLCNTCHKWVHSKKNTQREYICK